MLTYPLAFGIGPVVNGNVSFNGVITKPNQPSFSAYKSAVTANVTGAGAVYQVICDTELYDQAENYNATSGNFIAPVTGRYSFSGAIYVTGFTAATYFNAFLRTSNRNYQAFGGSRPATVTNDQVLNWSVEGVDMDAGDVANMAVECGGEAGNTDDVFGTSSPATYFMGRLEE